MLKGPCEGRAAFARRLDWTTVIQVSARSGMVHDVYVQTFKGSKVQRPKWTLRVIGSKDEMGVAQGDPVQRFKGRNAPPKYVPFKGRRLLWTLCIYIATDLLGVWVLVVGMRREVREDGCVQTVVVRTDESLGELNGILVQQFSTTKKLYKSKY